MVVEGRAVVLVPWYFREGACQKKASKGQEDCPKICFFFQGEGGTPNNDYQPVL